MTTIDLNCDMGEGMPNDALLMPYISSANIACGFHAGDEETMKRTVDLVLRHNVSIGAHPGFNDKKNFGRTEKAWHPDEIYDLISAQLHVLKNITDRFGTRITHVKPHGALYNMSAKDASLASEIAKAVMATDPSLVLFGLSGSLSVSVAQQTGLRTANEVFADRTYQPDGSLTPRSHAQALITDTTQSMQQVLQMICNQVVTCLDGATIPVAADTICIHSDGAHAVAFAQEIVHTLQTHHIGIKGI